MEACRIQRGSHMKILCGAVAFVAVLSVGPALAGDYPKNGNGSGQPGSNQPSPKPPGTGQVQYGTTQWAKGSAFTNMWSSAQGTSNSYGAGRAKSMSSANTVGNTGGGLQSTLGAASGLTSATSSFAKTSSNGNGYAQTQTSAYTGGSAFGSGSFRAR
jgi:hypothetical protein